jgi:hypothetical protein
MPEFKLLRGGLQDKFLASRTKIQIFGGGFGNGKTTAAVMKALQLCQDYPGMNCLMARSTYPKLNDTLRKEFLQWCPKSWIKSFPMSVNANNLCTLTNGSQFPFRYIAQQGKTEESTTSNLLSATYDLIVVDQAEDPEITYKDFLDLLGRLRGNTVYRGNDPTMPRTGPRWMLLTVNPTRNWIYTEIVEPYFQYVGKGEKGDADYQPGGKITDKLLCIRDENNQPVLVNDKPQLLIELVEGSTYDNRHNLAADFIQTQESIYRGQMRDRYLLGKWAAYEGLVYPQFDEQMHMIEPKWMKGYLEKLLNEGYDIEWLEGYDYGIASPSCYLNSFVDPHGNVFVVDGYYRREFKLEDDNGQWATIKQIRAKWNTDEDNTIDADPDIFRRGKGKTANTTVADLFWSDGSLNVRRAANDIIHGITKVSSYLNPRPRWTNPITLEYPAPSIYFSLDLRFVATEMAGYFWKKNSTTGEREDEPQDANDHSLDTIKYMLTTRPDASKLRPSAVRKVPAYMLWTEQDKAEARSRRHG